MNEIIVENVAPQNIVIGEGGATGITAVYVNGVDVTVGSAAYVIVPTKTSELINDSGFITSEQDPTVPFHVKQITTSDITKWNNKQDELISGQNIKTINNQSILGNGNLNVETIYTAGTGINITDEKVISNTITSYNDLTDLPTIPTSTSQLTNDSDFVSSSALSSVAFTGDYDDLLNKPDLSEYITKYVSDLVNYYNKDFFFNILPKVSDSGTSITLDDTIKGSQMYLTLGATELSQDGTPTPDSPQTIHTISGSNTLKVEGKNLIPNNATSQTINDVEFTVYDDGSIKINGTASGAITYVINSKVNLPDGQYTLSGCPSGGNVTSTFYLRLVKLGISSYLVDTGNSHTATISNVTNAQYSIYIFSGATLNNLIFKPMIEKGSTATSYTPYTLETADVDLDTLEYCKIGTYEDKFIRETDGTWQLEKNISKFIYNGEGTISSSATDYYNINNISIDGNPLGYITTPYTQTYLSNNFSAVPVYQSDSEFKSNTTSYSYCFGFHTNGTTIRFKDTRGLTLDAFKEDIVGTIIYYALATPTYTPITGTLAEQLENVYNSLKSEQDQTNISQVNNDLPFTISATTLKDLSSL